MVTAVLSFTGVYVYKYAASRMKLKSNEFTNLTLLE